MNTFFGQRVILGKYYIQVEESTCGTTTSSYLCRKGIFLTLALGTTRPPTSEPSKVSQVVTEEDHYVYFQGQLVQEMQPSPLDSYYRRFEAGSCRYLVLEGDSLTSIASRFMLSWQELFAFNAHLLEPSDIVPGLTISIGRHHTVQGPCLSNCYRQVQYESCLTDGDCRGSAKCLYFLDVGQVCVEYDSSCMENGVCLTCQWDIHPDKCGETLYSIATRYGTSWQRILDVNPQLAAPCLALLAPGEELGPDCIIQPGDRVCVVPYLRNAVCETVERHFGTPAGDVSAGVPALPCGGRAGPVVGGPGQTLHVQHGVE